MLPYFDYCLSLIIYFPKETIQKLSNCFNNCLYKLFKDLFLFKLVTTDDDSNNDSYNDSLNDYNLKLEDYGLFSFQHRILNKVLLFAYKIINNS